MGTDAREARRKKWPRRKRLRPKKAVTVESLDALEAQYRDAADPDPMLVHRVAVDAENAGLPTPAWVVRVWTRWSRRLLKARGSKASLKPEEIGQALELLDAGGVGRGTPLSRAAGRDRDAQIARIVEDYRKAGSGKVGDAIREVAESLAYTEDVVRNARNRHRQRQRESSR